MPRRTNGTLVTPLLLMAAFTLFGARTAMAQDTDLSIIKSDGQTTAVPGTSITYTIAATNNGPNTATGATVGDTFPAALTCTWTCVGTGAATCTASGSGNISDTVTLTVGDAVTYTASCAIAAAATGTLSNTATVAPPAGLADSGPGNNSVTDTDTLTPQADLAIVKTDGLTSVAPGSSTTYSLNVTNNGPSNATGGSVVDTFAASLTCTWTCVGSGGGSCTASGSGNINDAVSLPLGAGVNYAANCAVSAGAAGSLVNTATVTAPVGVVDPNPGNNAATDTDTLGGQQADLAILKTDGVTSVAAGGATTYTVTASNAGPDGITGGSVADTFPGSLTCTWTCVSAGGATCTASGSGNINDAVNIPSGGSTTYTASCAISAAAVGTLSNTATVAPPSGVADPTPANNSATDADTISVPVPALPTIGLLLLGLTLGYVTARRLGRDTDAPRRG